MNPDDTDRVFAGSIPELYERHLVPLIFEPYAEDLAARVASLQPASVLELAAGTGVVTRRLAAVTPATTRIVATDLSQPMLDQAMAVATRRPVEWRQADAMNLPFPAESFDAVVCQFGVMFFPDKAAAMSEALRVLKPGGVFAFNVWDRIEGNEFADVITQALAEVFPEDPPRFFARVPHGYHDQTTIRGDLQLAGFRMSPSFDTIAAISRAESARIPAAAYCQGTPLRSEIEARDAERLGDATEAAIAAIARRFGSGPVEGKIQAHVVSVNRPKE